MSVFAQITVAAAAAGFVVVVVVVVVVVIVVVVDFGVLVLNVNFVFKYLTHMIN